MRSATVLFALSALLPNVLCLDNGLAVTPPMGWLHWERFRCNTDCERYPDQCISENLFKRIGGLMVSEGYLDAGYEYVIIDDCWIAKERDENGRLQPDADRFPSGIAALADFIHGLGLKFGIYADSGTKTCAGFPGSIDSLQIDAETFADWGVDYLKFDGCNTPLDDIEEVYANMSRFLNETGRPMVFSCEMTLYKGLNTNYTKAAEVCNVNRNYRDVEDDWNAVADIANWFGENGDFINQFGGPGRWNDPDMLVIGNFGLSHDQAISQMTIWTILAAPLIISVELKNIDPEYKSILLNQVAIKINQDPLGKAGWRQSVNDDIATWVRQLSSEDKNRVSYAIGFVNNKVGGYVYNYTTTLEDCGISTGNKYNVTNVFEPNIELDPISTDEKLELLINPTGAVLLLFTPLLE